MYFCRKIQNILTKKFYWRENSKYSTLKNCQFDIFWRENSTYFDVKDILFFWARIFKLEFSGTKFWHENSNQKRLTLFCPSISVSFSLQLFP